jgi:hypothetical protein
MKSREEFLKLVKRSIQRYKEMLTSDYKFGVVDSCCGTKCLVKTCKNLVPDHHPSIFCSIKCNTNALASVLYRYAELKDQQKERKENRENSLKTFSNKELLEELEARKILKR